MTVHDLERAAKGAILAGLSLLLASCFIMPGKFDAQLQLLDDDRFSFVYDGEIHFMGLSDMPSGETDFEPGPCYGEDGSGLRECAEAELAEQRAAFEAEKAKSQRNAQQFAAMMGGLDPSDPETTQEVAQLLLRQEGWESVVPLGDGVFDVRYEIAGELSHGFLFPMIEGFPISSPFVQIHLRDNDVVRIDAPGFSPQTESNPLAAMMGGMGGLAQMAEEQNGEESPEPPAPPPIDGTFTIVTTGAILANNTDEGPEATSGGALLRWDVSSRTTSPPTALIDMAQ